MDKFGHEPLHYPDEVQPDKHRRDRDPQVRKSTRPTETVDETGGEPAGR